MKSRALITIFTLYVTFSSLTQAGTVGVDFGCTITPDVVDCIEGDTPLQDGYEGWVGPFTGNPGLDYSETQSLNGDFGVGGVFDLNITSDGLFFRDYGLTLSAGSPLLDSNNLLFDQILRNQPGSIVFAFSGLAAGEYSMKSYHHDSRFGSSTVPFNIIVEDELGIRTVATDLDTTGGYDPDSVTTALYTFAVGDSGLATITFDTAYADYGEHMSINGFELTGSPVPIAPAIYLFGSGLLGLIGVARRDM